MAKKGIFSWHLVVWPVVTWLIASGICFWLDKSDPAMELVKEPYWMPGVQNPLGEPRPIPGNPLEWAPVAWGLIAAGIIVILLYIFGVWIIYQHATRYNRNAVRWTTTSIVFTPVLAWIAYGLSWRKSP